MSPAQTVVFVCRHGSAKSLVAAEYLQRLAERQGLDLRATAAGVLVKNLIDGPFRSFDAGWGA